MALLCLMAVCHFQSSNKSSRMQDDDVGAPIILGVVARASLPKWFQSWKSWSGHTWASVCSMCWQVSTSISSGWNHEASGLQCDLKQHWRRNPGCHAPSSEHLPKCDQVGNLDSEVIRLVTWRHDSLIWNFCGNFMEWWCYNPFNGSKSLLDVSFRATCGDVDVFPSLFWICSLKLAIYPLQTSTLVQVSNNQVRDGNPNATGWVMVMHKSTPERFALVDVAWW